MKRTLTLIVGLVVGAGGVLLWSLRASPSTVQASEYKTARLPIVAVGCKITWNVPFVEGATEQQMLDIYAPPDAHDAPVVVYVHRGEWARGDKSEVCYKPKLLNENGIVFVSTNYRLSDVAQHPAQVDDVAAALKWVHDHISEYGGSPERVVLMGHSAGCHIVSMVGLDPRPLAKVGLEPSFLRGVVCWSGGAYDLPEKVAQGGMYKPYIEKNFGTDRAKQEDASPIQHVREVSKGERFLFISAGLGNPGSAKLSEKMAQEITAAGGNGRAVTLADKSHFTADYDCGRPEDPAKTGEMLLEFVHTSMPDALH